jgi:hypothetical protein
LENQKYFLLLFTAVLCFSSASRCLFTSAANSYGKNSALSASIRPLISLAAPVLICALFNLSGRTFGQLATAKII